MIKKINGKVLIEQVELNSRVWNWCVNGGEVIKEDFYI